MNYEQQHEEDLQRIRGFRLIDDDFMNACFDNNIEDTELILRIILNRPDISVKRARLAKEAGCTISIDMASYNVVDSNLAFFHNLVENYVDIVFANETEAKAYTKKEPQEAIVELAKHCKIAVVKVGKAGSMVMSGNEYHFIEPWPAKPVDATGAGDTYAAGFLYAHSLGMPLKVPTP